jgi:hypothetical protein
MAITTTMAATTTITGNTFARGSIGISIDAAEVQDGDNGRRPVLVLVTATSSAATIAHLMRAQP